MTYTSNRIAISLASAMALGAFTAAGANAQSAQALTQAQLSIDLEAGTDIQTIANQIAAALAEQGYRVVEAKQTWLGRLKVVAENAEARREVVVSSATGEIMRDSIVDVFAQGEASSEGRNGASGAAAGKADAQATASTSGSTAGRLLGGLTNDRDPKGDDRADEDGRSERSSGGASVRGSVSASGSLGLGL